MKIRFALWFCMVLFAVAGQSGHAAKVSPLLPGEKAVYQLSWSFFAVGTVEIRIDQSEESVGVLQARLDAKANAFMRKVHDFHTVITSHFFPPVDKSLGYARAEVSSENVHETIFDWETGTVRYSKNNDVRIPLVLQPLVQDPLSAVFAFRGGAIPLTPGTHHAWVTDGEVIDLVEFKVSGPEKVKVPAGKFETYRVRADFKGVRAIFARPEGAPIDVWLTNDERMIPVQLKSEATIGSFRSELVEYQAGVASE